jgi:putative phosphoribosyl transferase
MESWLLTLLGSAIMRITTPFKDRSEAGALLASALRPYLHGDVVILGLPRGGVPVAATVAKECHAPLDVFLVRKIGSPGHEELAAGAIASGGVVVWNQRVLRALGITPSELHETLELEEIELHSRERDIRTTHTPPLMLRDKVVVLVDDGIATGATMRAAIRAVKMSSPKEVIVALPVGPNDTCLDLERGEKVRVVCMRRIPSDSFGSVGQWYDDFAQVETEECRSILEKSRSELPSVGVVVGGSATTASPKHL